MTCTIASSTLFSVLGARPLYGDVWPEARDFTREFLVMLSHRVWQQRFGGRPDVVGSTIITDGAPYRVTGVLPEGFDFPVRTDVFRSALGSSRGWPQGPRWGERSVRSSA